MASSLIDILNDLDDLASHKDKVSVGDVVGKVGHRGQGAFLALPGLIGMTPVGGIPGVPTMFACLVAIASLQMLVGRDHLRLPGLLERRSFGRDRVRGAVRHLRTPGRWIDRHFSQRLEWATGPAATRIAALLALVFAALLPPLELVPFAGVIPFIAIALLGLALTMRDGLLMLVAFAGSAVALWGIWRVVPFT